MASSDETAGAQKSRAPAVNIHPKGAAPLLQQLDWLVPLRELVAIAGSIVDQHIEQKLSSPKGQIDIFAVQMEEDQAAVVMSANRYEEILRLKALCNSLVNKHNIAIDALFKASADELNATYRPGMTETAN